MEHIYNVQAQAPTYYRHIPRVPDTFPVAANALQGLENDAFVAAFAQFAELMERMYKDIELRPDAYGMPLTRLGSTAPRKSAQSVLRESWRAIKRLGDVLFAIGSLGEPSDGGLRVEAAAFNAAMRRQKPKLANAHLILDRLLDFGFTLTDYDSGEFAKGAAAFTVAFPENPLVMSAIRAYCTETSFYSSEQYDPHGFYYFDYKLVADRDKLPPHIIADDLAAMIAPHLGDTFRALHRRFVDDFGLSTNYKDDSIEYFLKKKRVARFIIDFSTLETVLILKLKDMDRYIDLVDALPPELRSNFEYSRCSHCGFQGATDEFCKFRLLWTLDGTAHEACTHVCFYFASPVAAHVEPLAGLMQAEYKF